MTRFEDLPIEEQHDHLIHMVTLLEKLFKDTVAKQPNKSVKDSDFVHNVKMRGYDRAVSETIDMFSEYKRNADLLLKLANAQV